MYECNNHPIFGDHGNKPLIINIEYNAKFNPYFRTALWTGNNLQITLMSIPAGGDIGVEMHNDVDQIIRIESGCALVSIGKCQNSLTRQRKVDSNYLIVIPAGTWHNITNVGSCPLKLSSIYSPPNHPFGTIQKSSEHDE